MEWTGPFKKIEGGFQITLMNCSGFAGGAVVALVRLYLLVTAASAMLDDCRGGSVDTEEVRLCAPSDALSPNRNLS